MKNINPIKKNGRYTGYFEVVETEENPLEVMVQTVLIRLFLVKKCDRCKKISLIKKDGNLVDVNTVIQEEKLLRVRR